MQWSVASQGSGLEVVYMQHKNPTQQGTAPTSTMYTSPDLRSSLSLLKSLITIYIYSLFWVRTLGLYGKYMYMCISLSYEEEGDYILHRTLQNSQINKTK